MARGFGGWIEKIIFAGMKSGGTAPALAAKQRGPLRRAVDAYLSGGRNHDPLYLSNRTWKDHFLVGLRIAIPLLSLAGAGIWYIKTQVVPKPPPKYDLSPAEILAKLQLPDLSGVKSEARREVEVVEAVIVRGASPALAGMVRNSSAHVLASAEVDFDIADTNGARLSTQTVQFRDLAPSAEARFRVSIADAKAQIAIVRAIRTKE
jgi:hypothetical protein